ncbi:MFS transporter [Paenarthrobacter sp. NPDC089714]|uniref:MFS transporter n=1 Tax=unclassified Paenarthrobacter TaxID=2634190 RepID=UPI00381592EC
MAGSLVALPVLAIEQAGNVAMGGVLVAAFLGPSVIAAPVAGAALDMARRPAVPVAASGLLTATAFAVAAMFSRELPLMVVVGMAIAGAVSPFYMGGMSSFAWDVIPDKRRAFAYDALSYNVAAVAGPALVALLAAFLSAQTALFTLAAIALAGTMCVGVLKARRGNRTATPAMAVIKAGLQRTFAHRPLAVVTLSSTLTQVGQGGLAIALVALSVDRSGSPQEGAGLVTAFTLGSLAGALVETIRPSRAKPHRTMAAGFVATGVFTILAALDMGQVWAVVTIALSGVFTASTTTAMLLLRDRHSGHGLKSQVFSVSAGLRTSASAGGAILTTSVGGWGSALSLASLGMIWIISATVLIAYPASKAP